MNVHAKVGDNWAKEMEALSKRDEELSLFEYWSTENKAHEATNKLQRGAQKAIPHHWRWSDLLPCIEKSGELVPIEHSERRTLILRNPGLAPAIATVATMYAGYRINFPRETAPAHRHSPNAVRLGLTGDKNFTAVEGEHITFGPGDLVLTPHDCWHSHGNEGEEPAINVSFLDHPLINSLQSTYFDSELWVEEQGTKVLKAVQDERYPRNYSFQTYRRGGLKSRTVSHFRGTGNASPMYVYRWNQTRDFLEEMKTRDEGTVDGLWLDYIDPTTGGPVYPTMTFAANLLRPAEKSAPTRQRANLLCTVLEGEGTSVAGGQRFDWKQFDTFCIPSGEWYEHHNNTKQDAVLFITTDEPAQRSLGLYNRYMRKESGEVVRVDR